MSGIINGFLRSWKYEISFRIGILAHLAASRNIIARFSVLRRYIIFRQFLGASMTILFNVSSKETTCAGMYLCIYTHVQCNVCISMYVLTPSATKGIMDRRNVMHSVRTAYWPKGSFRARGAQSDPLVSNRLLLDVFSR